MSPRRCPTEQTWGNRRRPVPRWPETFGATPDDRRAVLSIASLFNFSPRLVFELAERHGTASGCVGAILDGEAGVRSDREQLREIDPTVVSGGALGIDARSHEGAIRARGPTIAVLGNGIDRLHPATNRRILEEVERFGALVSEYPPGVRPDAFRFPARNRIIAALSEAV